MAASNTTTTAPAILPMQVLTAMGENWKYGHGKNFAILRSTSAIVSTISSFFLIRMVFGTRQRASTTYHRLILGMAIGDILFSLPLATFQVMSPSEMSYYVWGARGNQATCTLNGLLVGFGLAMTIFYNCSLNVYYVFAVRYNRGDIFIKKKVEPLLHGFPLLLALVRSVTILIQESYNDAGAGNCNSSPEYYPPHCIGYEDGEVRPGFTIPCGRGNGKSFTYYSGLVYGFTAPIIVIVSMIIIYRAVSKQEKRMARFGEGSLRQPVDSSRTASSSRSNARSLISSIRSSITSRNNSTRNTQNSRAVLHKAFAYTMAFFLAWGWPIGSNIMKLAGVKVPIPYLYFSVILQPLAGLYNLYIFIHPKVMAMRSRSSVSWCKAVGVVVWSGLSIHEMLPMRPSRSLLFRRTPDINQETPEIQAAPDKSNTILPTTIEKEKSVNQADEVGKAGTTARKSRVKWKHGINEEEEKAEIQAAEVDEEWNENQG